MAIQNTAFQDCLGFFDESKLERFHQRRAAFKYLCDFYYSLTLVVGTEFIGLNRDVLKTYLINMLFGTLTPFFSSDKNYSTWEETIHEISNMRGKVEHNIDCDLPKDRLLALREKAPAFRDWILGVGIAYHHNHNNSTFKDAFTERIEYHLREATEIIAKYKGKTNIGPSEQQGVEILSSIVGDFAPINTRRTKSPEITSNDLYLLSELIRVISRFDGREDAFLSISMCPECGGKIVETSVAIGGSEDEEPSGFRIHVGCEKCSYTLADEFV